MKKLLSGILFMFLVGSAYAAQDDLDRQIAQRQADLATLRNRVDPKIQPLLKKSDLSVRVSESVLKDVATLYNSQPDKTVIFQATEATGPVFAGSKICDYTVALSYNNLHGNLTVQSLALEYLGSGQMRAGAEYVLDVNGSFNGKACNLWDDHWTFEQDFDVHVSSQGNLWADIGVSSNDRYALWYSVGNLRQYPVCTGSDCNAIPIKGQLEFEDVPIEISETASFDLPPGVLVEGGVPNMFSGQGEISLRAPLEFRRLYLFSLRNISGRGEQHGYVFDANVTIEWGRQPTPIGFN